MFVACRMLISRGHLNRSCNRRPLQSELPLGGWSKEGMLEALEALFHLRQIKTCWFARHGMRNGITPSRIIYLVVSDRIPRFIPKTLESPFESGRTPGNWCLFLGHRSLYLGCINILSSASQPSGTALDETRGELAKSSENLGPFPLPTAPRSLGAPKDSYGS